MHAMKPQGQRFPVCRVCVSVHLVSALCIWYQSWGDASWEPGVVWLSLAEQCRAQRLQPVPGCAVQLGIRAAGLAGCPQAVRRPERRSVGAVLTPTAKATQGRACPGFFKCKFLLVHYYHVLLQQIIKRMWLVGSTVELFILPCCFFQYVGSELC